MKYYFFHTARDRLEGVGNRPAYSTLPTPYLFKPKLGHPLVLLAQS